MGVRERPSPEPCDRRASRSADRGRRVGRSEDRGRWAGEPRRSVDRADRNNRERPGADTTPSRWPARSDRPAPPATSWTPKGRSRPGRRQNAFPARMAFPTIAMEIGVIGPGDRRRTEILEGVDGRSGSGSRNGRARAAPAGRPAGRTPPATPITLLMGLITSPSTIGRGRISASVPSSRKVAEQAIAASSRGFAPPDWSKSRKRQPGRPTSTTGPRSPQRNGNGMGSTSPRHAVRGAAPAGSGAGGAARPSPRRARPGNG